MADVFKKRFMTSYARHVTQNEFFSIPLYPPPEYLSNDIWFVGVIRSRSPTKKNKPSLCHRGFPAYRYVIEHCAENWLTSKNFISSASKNKCYFFLIIRWVIYRSVLCQKIGIFFPKITNMGCPFPQKRRKSSKNGF